MERDPIERGVEFDGTLRAFRALARTAAWDDEEQVRSILVCLHQLIDDGDLPANFIEQLFDILEALAIAERD